MKNTIENKIILLEILEAKIERTPEDVLYKIDKVFNKGNTLEFADAMQILSELRQQVRNEELAKEFLEKHCNIFAEVM